MGQEENIRGHSFERKGFLICVGRLSPQAEKKQDDEHFAHYLHMYASGTFPTVRNSAVCTEYQWAQNSFYPNGTEYQWAQNSFCSNGKYISQVNDKFLKSEDMEYLIHYVKFKRWPVFFLLNFHCLSNSSIH